MSLQWELVLELDPKYSGSQVDQIFRSPIPNLWWFASLDYLLRCVELYHFWHNECVVQCVKNGC